MIPPGGIMHPIIAVFCLFLAAGAVGFIIVLFIPDKPKGDTPPEAVVKADFRARKRYEHLDDDLDVPTTLTTKASK